MRISVPFAPNRKSGISTESFWRGYLSALTKQQFHLVPLLRCKSTLKSLPRLWRRVHKRLRLHDWSSSGVCFGMVGMTGSGPLCQLADSGCSRETSLLCSRGRSSKKLWTKNCFLNQGGGRGTEP